MVKSNILFVGVIFSIILVASISPSYAEYTSPKKQIELGALPEDVICRDGKVLVIRDNGKVACVHDSTAEKLEWNIIKIEFEENHDDDDFLSALSTDLSNTVLSSNVLEGNYKIGLWSESMKGVTRAPSPSLIDNVYNTIILPDGSPLISIMTLEYSSMSVQDFVEKNTQVKTPNDYLNHFPTYIPDGLELKFFTFSSTVYSSEEHIGISKEYVGLSGTSLYLIYLPISVDVDPTLITGAKIMDLGGIIIDITDTPGNSKYLEIDHIDKMQTLGGHTLTVFNNVNIFWGGEETSFLIPSNNLFRITSMGNSPEEMIEMAKSIIINMK